MPLILFYLIVVKTLSYSLMLQLINSSVKLQSPQSLI